MELSNGSKEIPMQSQADLTLQNQSCRDEMEIWTSQEDAEKENYYYSLKVCKNHTLKIFKPLVPLNVIHFIWHAISTVILTFFIVYLKQEGITLEEIFLAYTLAPIGQVISMSLFSVLMDKFGHAKVYLISGLLTSGILMMCILNLPPLKEPSCSNNPKSFFKCENDKWYGKCELPNLLENVTQKVDCLISCSMDSVCDMNNMMCSNSTGKNVALSITRPLKCSENSTDSPYFNDDSTGLPFLCNLAQHNSCNLTCLTNLTQCNVESKQRKLLGILYVVLIVALYVTFINTYRFLDISAQALIKRYKADFGHVRLWASIGYICGPILAGFIVHLTSSGKTTNYSSCMYYYSATCLLVACIAFKMEICGLDRGTDMWKKYKNLITSLDVLIFYLLLLVLGTSWAVCMIYRTWHLEELGASSNMFSVLDILRDVCGVVLLFKSKWLLDKIGEIGIFLLSLFGYAVYQFSYSFLETAWPAVFIELIRVFSYNLLWVAVIYHCIRITPKGLAATVTSSAGVLHFTFGRFIGGFLGGVLITNFGGRAAFQILGFVNLTFATAYVAYLFYRKRKGFIFTAVEQVES